MLITIFTPSYNRADLITRVYGSLVGQTNQRFEWLIVDDGSTDNTREVVEEINSKHESSFSIRYIYKSNGGKHSAINVGVQEAKGELFLILDSDDSLPKNALQIILQQYPLVKNEENLAGVCGLMAHHDGTQIGSGFPKNPMFASSIEMRYAYRVTGDLMEVFKTNVLREFPFPEINGERFCPEDLVWNRIAHKYKFYCFNEVIYYRDYLDGGLTDNIMRIRHFSPLASMTYYQELYHAPIPLKERIKAAINYWRFTPSKYYGKVKEMYMMNLISLCVLPLGILMRLNDKRHL